MPEAKYSAIVEKYEHDIRSGVLRPGDRIPSAREMKALFGVSNIVSLRVFRILAERGLIRRRPGEGYCVAAVGEEVRRNKILCAFRLLKNIGTGDDFGNKIFDGIVKTAAGFQQTFVLVPSSIKVSGRYPADEDVRVIADEIFSFSEITGVLLDMRISDEQIRRYILPRAENIPVVTVGRKSKLDILSSAIPLSEIGTQLGRLARRSAKNFVFCSKSVPVFPDGLETGEAFVRELGACRGGRVLPPLLLPPDKEERLRTIDAAEEMIRKHQGDIFIMCCSDYCGRTIVDEMTKRGLEPGQDFLLTGIGGSGVNHSVSGKELSTVVLDAFSIGSNAVKLLMNNMPGKTGCCSWHLECKETF